jgi:hypothetical protein
MFMRDDAPEERPIDIAVRLGELTKFHIPDDVVVAIFVFRKVEEDVLQMGFVSGTVVGLLRDWMKRWLRETKPKRKESVQ